MLDMTYNRYKDTYQKLKDLKIEIEHLQHLLEQARIRLTRAFEAWYVGVYLGAGEEVVADAERGTIMDENDDDGRGEEEKAGEGKDIMERVVLGSGGGGVRTTTPTSTPHPTLQQLQHVRNPSASSTATLYLSDSNMNVGTLTANSVGNNSGNNTKHHPMPQPAWTSSSTSTGGQSASIPPGSPAPSMASMNSMGSSNATTVFSPGSSISSSTNMGPIFRQQMMMQQHHNLPLAPTSSSISNPYNTITQSSLLNRSSPRPGSPYAITSSSTPSFSPTSTLNSPTKQSSSSPLPISPSPHHHSNANTTSIHSHHHPSRAPSPAVSASGRKSVSEDIEAFYKARDHLLKATSNVGPPTMMMNSKIPLGALNSTQSAGQSVGGLGMGGIGAALSGNNGGGGLPRGTPGFIGRLMGGDNLRKT
jgi:hypothetical protein